ncbi:hypothetical protein ACO1JH_10200, partial [Staphylococcus aureus]
GYKNMPSKTQFVKHGDIIQVGNVKLEVLHTPGHTPESISFLLMQLKHIYMQILFQELEMLL